MAHPYHHSLSSARRWGGTVEDYLAVHEWFDQTKAHFADFRHRALRHHCEGIDACQQHFGVTITTSAGRVIPVRWVAEQHVKEDLGWIPTAADWLRAIHPEPWMNRRPRTRLRLLQPPAGPPQVTAGRGAPDGSRAA